jgi:hypothetical protein
MLHGRAPVRFRAKPVMRGAPKPAASPFDIFGMMDELRTMHADFKKGLETVVKAVESFDKIKSGSPGAPGIPGSNGKSVTQEQVAAEVRKLYKQPADGVAPTSEEVAAVIMQDPKIFRFIKKRLPKAPQDGVSPEVQQVVDAALSAIKGGALKIEHVAGLDGKFREVYNQLAGKIYGKDTTVRGGGDTVEAGSNVTITETVNGRKRISVAPAALSVIALTGAIDDSNMTFTAASQPTLLCINGSFYQKTGGAFTWDYLAGTITISSPVGTGGSIFGI